VLSRTEGKRPNKKNPRDGKQDTNVPRSFTSGQIGRRSRGTKKTGGESQVGCEAEGTVGYTGTPNR